MGTLKLITELIVGLAPAGPGLVWIEESACAAIGGTIDLSKKSMYAFFTGSKPGD